MPRRPSGDPPPPPLTPDLLRLAAALLAGGRDAIATDAFEVDQVPGFETIEARRELDRLYNVYNRSPDEHDPEDVNDHRRQPGWALAGFLATVLDAAAGPPPQVDPKAARADAIARAAADVVQARLVAQARVRERDQRVQEAQQAEEQVRDAEARLRALREGTPR